MSIERLARGTRSKLRSTQILTSLPQIVTELVQNSLDAGASNIDVGVNCEDWNCWVRDDGHGMAKDGLDIVARGSEDGRYGSSKAYAINSLSNVSTFGFRGEALASAADLSCLEISSRTSHSRETWSVIVKSGKCLYSGPAVRWRMQTSGTVVCIRDAFFNLPVRRLSHPSPSRTLETIRRDLEQVALIFPGVTFSLEDSKKADSEGWTKGRLMTIPKTGSTLLTFRHIYGRALARHVEEIDVFYEALRLQGFISLDGAPTKAHQYLYINNHLLASCDLHRTIDDAFASSTFLKHAYEEEGETSVPRQATRRSPRKQERKPVYVLNLSMSSGELDNCLDPAKANVQLKDNRAAQSLLSSVVGSFLTRNGFRNSGPSNVVESRDKKSTLPRKRLKVDGSFETSSVGTRQGENPTAVRWPPGTDVHLYALPEDYAGEEEAPEVVWADPSTGRMFVVDRRTGNSSLRTNAGTDGDARGTGHLSGRRTLTKPRKMDGGVSTDAELSAAPEWIREALQTNEVYDLTEPRIPTLPLSPGLPADFRSRNGLSSGPCDPHRYPPLIEHHGCGHAQNAGWGSTSWSPASQFDRAQLRAARVLEQVDRKFIACLLDASRQGGVIPLDGASTPRPPQNLVLIDQHAADERVRVEQFLQELCSGFLRGQDGYYGDVKGLEPPVPVLLTRYEAKRLTSCKDFQMAFSRWGIRFKDLDKVAEQNISADLAHPLGRSEGEAYAQVYVSAVPAIVSQKLVAGDDLRELIKGYLGRMEEEGAPSYRQDVDCAEDGPFSWLRALRWCPRQLIEVVNSKACRGAIMFNDSLSLVQCEQLIQKLADTAFPFQCAHGRPSLVPLANIGSLVRTSGRRRADVDWANSDFSISS